MEKIAIYLTDLCVKEGIIKEDYDIYYYGFIGLVGFVINSILIFIAGLLLRHPIESIIFLSVFGTIREYSGGYHADTSFKCTVFSVLTFIVCLMLSWIFGEYVFCGSFISLFLIIDLAPVTNVNKPNSPSLLVMAKRNTKVLSIFFYTIAIVGELLSRGCLRIIHSVLIAILFLMIVQIKKENKEHEI